MMQNDLLLMVPFLGPIGAIGMVVLQEIRHRTILCHAATRLAEALPIDTLETERPSKPADLDICVDRICERLSTLEHRIVQRHPTTGLETREVLLAALATPESSARDLGVIAFTDFDTMAAFDADAADQVLNTLAQRLARMVPSNRLLAQIDRATFAILFESGAGADVASQLNTLCYALCGSIEIGGTEYLPQLRHAYVPRTEGNEKPSAIVAQALALVHSTSPVYLHQASTAADDHFALEQDLRRAVERHQLELWYQPVIDATTSAICSVEALIRWRHPVRGLVPPSDFIPIMESLSLSEEVGHWVLDRPRATRRHGRARG